MKKTAVCLTVFIVVILSSSFAFGHSHSHESCHANNVDSNLDSFTVHHNTETDYSVGNCIPSCVNDCEFELYNATCNLNIRSLPTTESKILGGFLKGESVNVCAIEDGWATIDHCGMIAYVSAEYIQKADNYIEDDDITHHAH